MVCPSCNVKNAEKNYYCGICGSRIRPVGHKLEQDILWVVEKRSRARRNRRFIWAGLIVSGLGVFGFAGMHEMVSVQIEKMRPGIIRDANLKAQEVINREMPAVLAKAMDTAVQKWSAEIENVNLTKFKAVEQIYATAERDARDRAQRSLERFDRSVAALQTPPQTAPTSQAGHIVDAYDTQRIVNASNPVWLAASVSSVQYPWTPATGYDQSKILTPADSVQTIAWSSSLVPGTVFQGLVSPTPQQQYAPLTVCGLNAARLNFEAGHLSYNQDCGETAVGAPLNPNVLLPLSKQ